MFMGEYQHTMDAKGRIIIPSKLRDALGEGAVVTRGQESCLTIYTKGGFEALSARLQEQASAHPQLIKSLSRFLFSQASVLEFDKQGRVLIPAPLRAHAGIEKDAVIVGVNDRIEIWNQEEWDRIAVEAANALDIVGSDTGIVF